MRYVLAVLAVVIGVAAVVYGEADDSPGLQLLGVLLVLATGDGGLRIVTVDPACGPAGGALIAQLVVA